MNMLNVLGKNSIQNVHAPLPLTAHIIFCVIATLLYLVQFKRKKMKYYIYLLAAVDLTLLTQTAFCLHFVPIILLQRITLKMYFHNMIYICPILLIATLFTITKYCK